MKTSIATVSISGNLREKLDAIARAGFDGIEIFEQDVIADEGSPRETGQLIRDHGLEITLFQPFRAFEGLTGVAREQAFDRAGYKFDTMADPGTDPILVCSSVRPDALGGSTARRTTLPSLGARGRTQPARRPRGAGPGPPGERPPRCLGNRAPRRSPECRIDP